MDCCLVLDSKLINHTVVEKQDVISGPKFCPFEKKEVTERKTSEEKKRGLNKDIFYGKTTQCRNIP